MKHEKGTAIRIIATAMLILILVFGMLPIGYVKASPISHVANIAIAGVMQGSEPPIYSEVMVEEVPVGQDFPPDDEEGGGDGPPPILTVSLWEGQSPRL